jgi:hypothetical protein
MAKPVVAGWGTGVAQQERCGESTFPNLDPLGFGLHVNLEPLGGVRMGGGQDPIPTARQRRVHDEVHHLA